MKIANRSFENVSQIRYWGITNRSELDSGGNLEEIEFEQCLLLFSQEPFIFCYAV
jgi:hypothetical protein